MGQGGTISFSDNAASHATYDVGRFNPACLPGDTYCAFTYDERLGGWVTTQGDAFTFSGAMGVSCGPPLEFYADLCVRSGCFSGSVMSSTFSMYEDLASMRLLSGLDHM